MMFLAGAASMPTVFALRPDYRVLLLAVDGLVPGAQRRDQRACSRRPRPRPKTALRDRAVEELPHVAAWREAYRAFGAKPQRTRNSLEALFRRAASGLPRVNRLTDIYNAVSVLHQVPLGGEDLRPYTGPRAWSAPPATSRSTPSPTASPVIEYPDPGEVVWCDDAGVTCRRWNWRQARRTQLTDDTTTALFILDALDPMTDERSHAAGR